MRALWQKIAEGARQCVAVGPLRAVAVTVRLRGMLANFSIPGHATQPRKRLAKNLYLQAPLLGKFDVLEVAAAANAKMRARGCDARRRGLHDLEQLRMDQLFLFCAHGCAHLLAREHVGDEYGVAIGVSQAVTSIQ